MTLIKFSKSAPSLDVVINDDHRYILHLSNGGEIALATDGVYLKFPDGRTPDPITPEDLIAHLQAEHDETLSKKAPEVVHPQEASKKAKRLKFIKKVYSLKGSWTLKDLLEAFSKETDQDIPKSSLIGRINSYNKAHKHGITRIRHGVYSNSALVKLLAQEQKNKKGSSKKTARTIKPTGKSDFAVLDLGKLISQGVYRVSKSDFARHFHMTTSTLFRNTPNYNAWAAENHFPRIESMGGAKTPFITITRETLKGFETFRAEKKEHFRKMTSERMKQTMHTKHHGTAPAAV